MGNPHWYQCCFPTKEALNGQVTWHRSNHDLPEAARELRSASPDRWCEHPNPPQPWESWLKPPKIWPDMGPYGPFWGHEFKKKQKKCPQNSPILQTNRDHLLSTTNQHNLRYMYGIVYNHCFGPFYRPENNSCLGPAPTRKALVLQSKHRLRQISFADQKLKWSLFVGPIADSHENIMFILKNRMWN